MDQPLLGYLDPIPEKVNVEEVPKETQHWLVCDVFNLTFLAAAMHSFEHSRRM